MKAYAFLSQIIPFKDKELFKFYIFAEALAAKLPGEKVDWPTEILRDVDLEKYKPELVGTEALGLSRGDEGVDPRDFGEGATLPEEELEQLSKIIEELNDAFGTSFTLDDRVIIGQLQEQISEDQFLSRQVDTSSRDAVRAAFEEVARDLLENLIDSNFKFYKKVQDDDQLSQTLFDKHWNNITRKRRPSRPMAKAQAGQGRQDRAGQGRRRKAE